MASQDDAFLMCPALKLHMVSSSSAANMVSSSSASSEIWLPVAARVSDHCLRVHEILREIEAIQDTNQWLDAFIDKLEKLPIKSNL